MLKSGSCFLFEKVKAALEHSHGTQLQAYYLSSHQQSQ